MKIESLFSGRPKEVSSISTSMPREQRPYLEVYKDRIIGDQISNTKHHGGERRVIHQFPVENYTILSREYPQIKFYPGCLGENISSSGMGQGDVCIGDVYEVGDIKCVVTEPRKPCWTIDHLFNEKGLGRFIQNELITGWFYQVIEEGKLEQGDIFKLVSRPCPELDIESCVSALLVKPYLKLLEIMSESHHISPNWSTPASRVLLTNTLEDDSYRLKDK